MSKRRKKVKEIYNVDSLKDIKDMTENNKLNKIDEKIELLKTELKLLLNDRIANKSNYSFIARKNNLLDDEFEKVNQTKPKYFESDNKQTTESHKDSKDEKLNVMNNFKPSCSSTPSKFSEWLSKTIDEINLESTKSESLHAKNLFHSKLHVMNEKPSVIIDSTPRNSNSCLLSQQEIEKLLYRSLVLKTLNSKMYSSYSEDDSVENLKSLKTSKHQKFQKPKKPFRSPRRQKLKSKERNFFQREKKRKKNLNSQSDAEIINPDNYSSNHKMSKVNTILPETSTACVDLDTCNSDWNETFDLSVDYTSHFNSKKPEGKEKKALTYDQKLESECAELMDSISYDEIGKCKPKRIWECPVCFERSIGQEIVATQCGHVFCKKCLESHFSNLGRSCPSCRTELAGKPIITLFNF